MMGAGAEAGQGLSRHIPFLHHQLPQHGCPSPSPALPGRSGARWLHPLGVCISLPAGSLVWSSICPAQPAPLAASTAAAAELATLLQRARVLRATRSPISRQWAGPQTSATLATGTSFDPSGRSQETWQLTQAKIASKKGLPASTPGDLVHSTACEGAAPATKAA